MGFFENWPWLHTLLSAGAVIAAAFLANVVVKAVLLKGLRRVLLATPFGRDGDLMRHGVVARLANLVPALVIIVGVRFVPHLPDALVLVVRNVGAAFVVLTISLAASAALNLGETLWNRRPDAREKPIKGYVQIVKIALFIVAGLLMLAILLDRSPLILLSGLGAMAAVLMLVFQDTLLSLVASVQISSSDMVRLGDWIEMPQLNADGDVIEIALHTVKVQNWDKTITTLPTRKLISEPFKNWRGMQMSGGRRIKRSILLDQSSVRFLEDEEIDGLSDVIALRPYIAGKKSEIAGWNARIEEGGHNPVNLRRLTNLGTFRAYVERYLRGHPDINASMTLLVRHGAPGPEGLPLEIYCFTASTVWAVHEGVQSDIFEHIYAVMPQFGLRPFQSPSGADFSAFVREESEGLRLVASRQLKAGA